MKLTCTLTVNHMTAGSTFTSRFEAGFYIRSFSCCSPAVLPLVVEQNEDVKQDELSALKQKHIMIFCYFFCDCAAALI